MGHLGRTLSRDAVLCLTASWAPSTVSGVSEMRPSAPQIASQLGDCGAREYLRGRAVENAEQFIRELKEERAVRWSAAFSETWKPVFDRLIDDACEENGNSEDRRRAEFDAAIARAARAQRNASERGCAV